MEVNIVVGCQWGDEGKGKIVDMLSAEHDVIVRYQGGANAGHTVEIGNKKYVLHLIPSGILWPHTECVIGNGVVLDPNALIDELKLLNNFNINTGGRLFISENCHLIMPYHKLLDSVAETSSVKIGTTGRGIGPCYVDKANRRGIRFSDLFTPTKLQKLIQLNLYEKKEILRDQQQDLAAEGKRIYEEYLSLGEQLRQYLSDTVALLHDRRAKNKKILLEGAQGTMLDVDHGTYPYVTSSNPTTGGAFTGTGLPPNFVKNITGVLKAYSTRVGEGPFPTECFNSIGETLRRIGNEYGATTGRPRRCGWFDLPLAKYSIAINGVTEIALTKLDVLNSFEKIPVCTAYTISGSESAFSNNTLSEVNAVYETLDGWQSETENAKSFAELPQNARNYVVYLEDQLRCRIRYVSTGPERTQTIEK